MLLQEQSFDVQPNHGDQGQKLYLEGVMMQAEIKNHNGRSYKKEQIQNAVNIINEQANSGHYILGECDHPCFDSTAEVLTHQGWKRFYDLDGSETVYSMNPETKDLEESPVHEVHDNPFEGQMIRIKNQSFNTLVTPNHKFLVYHSTTGKYGFITAQEIYEHVTNNIPGISKWGIPRRSHGVYKSHPSTILFEGEEGCQGRYEENLELDFDDFCEFLGLYLAEGSVSNRSPNGYRISISQNEGTKANKIRSILSKLGFHWRENFEERKYNTHVVFSFSDARLGKYLHELGNCYTKYVPEDIKNRLDYSSAKALIDGFLLGDGRNEPDVKYTYCDIFSVSEQLIEDLSYVASLLGFSVRRYTEFPQKDYIFEERVIKAENKQPLHFAKFLHSDFVYLDPRSIEVTKEYYSGRVYCISANYSNFLARHNGYTFISGNSDRVEVHLSDVSHKLVEAQMNGNDAVCKAEILPTPKGEIVKNLIESGVKVGASSRGTGSVNESTGEVTQFNFKTIDVVMNSSAPNAYPQSIREAIELYKNNEELHKLAEAVRYDNQAQKYFQKEMKKFIESIFG